MISEAIMRPSNRCAPAGRPAPDPNLFSTVTGRQKSNTAIWVSARNRGTSLIPLLGAITSNASLNVQELKAGVNFRFAGP